MKKLAIVIILLALLFSFASCEQKYVPNPAVEEYLNGGQTAEKAFDKIAKVSYETTEITSNKNGDEQGRKTSKVAFDVTDKGSLKLTMAQTYSGIYVDEGVTERTNTLEKSGEGYLYKTVTNVEAKNSSREITSEVALDLITALIYKDNGAYNGGGLYYGDVFMLKIYKFPPESFYVDTDSDLCVFDEKMVVTREDVGNVRLTQITKINRLGLLTYDCEKYESDSVDRILTSEVIVEYEFVKED